MDRRVLWALGFCWISVAACSGGESELAPGTCRSQRDCATDEICLAGECSPANVTGTPCTVGSCPDGEFCDLTDQRCKPVGSSTDAGEPGPDGGPRDGSTDDASISGPCLMDSDCGTPPVDVCVANTCVKGCGEPDGLVCTGGTTCDTATGKCVDANSCRDDSDCGPPQRICENSTCVPGCVANPGLCMAGVEVCDTNTGRCVTLPNRCAQDSDCSPPSTVCENTQCVPGCGQPGGIQCSGTTPDCNTSTGRCQAAQACTIDADCMDPDQICVNRACTLRCDRGGSCPSPNVCNTVDGRCLPGRIALGDPCMVDAQCQSSVCLTINISMTSQRLCVQPCSATSQCPLDFTCGELDEMRFCLSENLSNPPARFDVRSGGACSQASNSCQSRWCDLNASTCLETCLRDSDCAGFGDKCWMFRFDVNNVTNYETFCEVETGGGPGAACTTDDQCQSNLCSLTTRTCAQFCCRDQDCGPTQNCVLYNLDAANLIKICAPRSAGAGTQALGSACTADNQCESELCIPADVTALTGPEQCSSRCCTHADCSFLGASARCRPVSGPVMGSLTGLCFDR